MVCGTLVAGSRLFHSPALFDAPGRQATGRPRRWTQTQKSDSSDYLDAPRFVMMGRPSRAPVDSFSACRRYRLLSGCATLTPPPVSGWNGWSASRVILAESLLNNNTPSKQGRTPPSLLSFSLFRSVSVHSASLHSTALHSFPVNIDPHTHQLPAHRCSLRSVKCIL